VRWSRLEVLGAERGGAGRKPMDARIEFRGQGVAVGTRFEFGERDHVTDMRLDGCADAQD
jgi:hypothetical protein